MLVVATNHGAHALVCCFIEHAGDIGTISIGEALDNEGENIRATANRPRRRPREPRRRPRLTPEQRAAYEEAERIADMKFYMLQIYKIIKPVVVCICLSILWVKISMAGSDYR